MKKQWLTIWVAALAIGWLCVPAIFSSDKDYIGDHQDGSRSPAVHVLDLIDEEGTKILPTDEPLFPFSVNQTCGECHDVETIRGGWHFNFNQEGIEPGRPAQPWIYADPFSGTQVGLSYRSWTGLYHPEEVGMTPWKFALHFGRQFPGNLSEKDEGAEPDFDARWLVSGTLEANCLACHNADPRHDQSEYAIQVFKENFRWAAPATHSVMSVKGAAKDMDDMWDYLLGDLPDDPKLIPPTVSYDVSQFNADNKVFFDVSREIPDARCYFCHSNSDAVTSGMGKWAMDEDVHLAAGMSCVDCHSNGKDHMIVRGYEGEEQVSDNPLAASSSCVGCHMGDHESEKEAAPGHGRFAAPYPKHPGIPSIHFEKMTCTACHSGPWPQKEARPTQTARAHGLGVHGITKTAEMLPHLYYPVFIRNEDGKIGPHKIFWPSFWAKLDENGELQPLDVQVVEELVRPVLKDTWKAAEKTWPELTEEKVAEVLKSLNETLDGEGKAVYIAGFKLHQLDENGLLVSEEHCAGAPVSWPMAHNVRPAEQSLGAKGCTDCHTTDAPFLFGKVAIDTPVVSQRGRFAEMIDFQGLDAGYMKSFASSFVFRPILKFVGFFIAFVLGMILLLYGLKALGAIIHSLDSEGEL